MWMKAQSSKLVKLWWLSIWVFWLSFKWIVRLLGLWTWIVGGCLFIQFLLILHLININESLLLVIIRSSLVKLDEALILLLCRLFSFTPSKISRVKCQPQICPEPQNLWYYQQSCSSEISLIHKCHLKQPLDKGSASWDRQVWLYGLKNEAEILIKRRCFAHVHLQEELVQGSVEPIGEISDLAIIGVLLVWRRF